MAGERASALKGRLADVYVPAILRGQLEALVKRLGSRATVDDPVSGRVAGVPALEELLAKTASMFANVTGASAATAKDLYRPVASTMGAELDASEGAIVTSEADRALPILVVAHRRRLREIDVRVYFAPEAFGAEASPRAPFEREGGAPVPQIIAHVLDALRKGAVERVLAACEESSRIVDAYGRTHAKRDGAMSTFLGELGFGVEIVSQGTADDGRTCVIEATFVRSGQDPIASAVAFERGESGLVREIRFYL